MGRIRHAVLITISGVILLGLYALTPHSRSVGMADELDRLLRGCEQNHLFAGSVLVAKGGKVVYEQSFGTINFDSKERITPDHALRLASVGKAFTAMSIMILEEEGKLSYEDDVRKHLAGFPYDGITIRHLLNHTSGLPDYVALMDRHWDVENAGAPERKTATSADALQKFIEHRPPVLFRPGDRYRYSNTGYIMLGLIAESASAMKYSRFLDERIFKPLGMNRTVLYSPIDDPPVGLRVYGYEIAADGSGAIATDRHYLNGMHGDGESYSTTSDMFLWDQALYTERLVSRKTLEEAFSPAVLNNGETSDYGFGWALSTDREGRKVVGHGGGWVGFRSEIVREIEKGDMTIILSTGSRARFRQIRKAVANIVHGRRYEIPGPPTAWTVGGALREGGIEAAVERYQALRAAHSKSNDYYEYRLYDLAAYCLERGRIETAVTLLKLDVESFPDRSRVYNALGNAYVRARMISLAEDCFRTSLSLDPADWNEAHRRLEEIAE